jgi:hypothetical protein
MALQHLRSSTANKRPTPAAMSDGQLAMNTNTASPGLFFKDSNGDSIKAGPAHVGTTAPNATPGAGGQAGNSKGELWLDTTGGTYVLKTWDGTAWRSVSLTGDFVETTGDTMTGALVMDDQGQVRFRETTANGTSYVALQAAASVASNKTITLPDATGTVVLSGAIVNADINASAAIADTKLATISTAGKVSGTAITSGNIDTSGELQITNAFPAVRLTESDGTATHSQTLIARAGDTFQLQTRSSTGVILSTDYQIPADASGATDHIWRIADTEKASLDSAGLTLAGYVQTNRIQNVEANEAIVLEPSDDSIQFISNSIERMRLNASGDLLVGTTTFISPATSTDEGSRISSNVIAVSRSGSVPLYLQRTTSDGTIASFYRQTTQVGTISVTTTATAYNTSSDYRLKENITLLDGAIARLNQLPVHRFNFIADPDTVVDGFIAHEAAAVVPECVTGEKDEVDEDGTPIYQGIDQSKVVPLLTAALQEAIAMISALEVRIAALEA